MWLTSAQSAIATDWKASYPHIQAHRNVPTLYDAHDWTQNKPPFRQGESRVKRGQLSKLYKRTKCNRVYHLKADEVEAGEDSD